MARKKGTPQKAPEYKKKAPGKAKDGSACYTRVNKGGGAYVTCTGTQGQKQTGKAVRSGPPPKGTKKGMAKRTGGAPGKVRRTPQAQVSRRKQSIPMRAPEYSSSSQLSVIDDLSGTNI
tara:strand:+ start:1289 stop:1645 length:357 start_codon:yes stop_codon:yes gene_type:complete